VEIFAGRDTAKGRFLPSPETPENHLSRWNSSIFSVGTRSATD
jgi:hypothetical protein